MSLLSQDGLDRLVAETCRAHAVPGVSVAVVAGDRTLLAADGVRDVATGVPVSTDTAFEIRSVSKLFTAALAMMLHDQGLVGLDDPVAAVLAQGGHGLQAAHGAISLAHLLSHSSGLEADYLAEAEDANAVAAFVERSAALPLLFAAGRTYSYSNIGTVWAGRMVEILTGLSWYQALHQHIAAPLDLPTLGVFPYGSSTTPHIAVGHVVDAAGRLSRVGRPGTPRAIGPAGGIVSTALDVARFGRALAAAGGLLAPATATLSQQVRVRSPNAWHHPCAQGLGWSIEAMADGNQVLGINGGGHDQGSFLRAIPSRDVTIAILTNGGQADLLAADILSGLYAAFGVVLTPAAAWQADVEPVPATLRPGRYSREGWSLLVRAGAQAQMSATIRLSGSLAAILHNPPDKHGRMLPDADVDGLYATDLGRFGAPAAAVFFREPESGRDYLHIIGRAAPRVADHGRKG